MALIKVGNLSDYEIDRMQIIIYLSLLRSVNDSDERDLFIGFRATMKMLDTKLCLVLAIYVIYV